MVITYANRQAKIQKVGSTSIVKVDITTNGRLDITNITKAIKAI